MQQVHEPIDLWDYWNPQILRPRSNCNPWFGNFFQKMFHNYTDLFSNSWWRKRKWLLPSTNACPSTRWIALSLQWKDDATKSDCVQVRSSVSCGISYNFCAIRFHIYFGCEFKWIRKNTILWTSGVQCSVKLAVKNKKTKWDGKLYKEDKRKKCKKIIFGATQLEWCIILEPNF